ncbi:MAG: IS1595 family transposase [Acidobacteria bacterium]|nr:IS1595 family transposase [Acidobacteriota bacterium]MYE44642.1 IS1595 family transposase [Acidobacteriota bacterium]
MAKQKAPGRSHRVGLSLTDLFEMFPDEESAHQWFEKQVWPDGEPVCPKCGSPDRVKATPNRTPLPYWCGECRRHFSVRMGTALERSRVPLRKWAIAIYLEMTSLKGVSSMKLHRDLKVTQKTAWFMLHRIREAWAHETGEQFPGPVEVDETYMGGKRRNMSKARRESFPRGGLAGKTAVAGAKDRGTGKVSAMVVERTDVRTLQGFIHRTTKPGATVFTDEHGAYRGLVGFAHESINHSVGEYVRGQAHTQGIESFWAMLKRAHTGTFHKISRKHLNRYVQEFAGKHNLRDYGTRDQMERVAHALVGRRLTYDDLTA